MWHAVELNFVAARIGMFKIVHFPDRRAEK